MRFFTSWRCEEEVGGALHIRHSCEVSLEAVDVVGDHVVGHFRIEQVWRRLQLDVLVGVGVVFEHEGVAAVASDLALDFAVGADEELGCLRSGDGAGVGVLGYDHVGMADCEGDLGFV